MSLLSQEQSESAKNAPTGCRASPSQLRTTKWGFGEGQMKLGGAECRLYSDQTLRQALPHWQPTLPRMYNSTFECLAGALL